MKTKTLLTSVLLVSAFAFGAVVLPSGGEPASAQSAASGATSHIFLKLDGVTGGALAKGYEKQIDVTSLNFGVARAGGGKPVHSDFAVTKAIDASSPVLFTKSATGERFKTATLTVVGGNNAAQIVYTLSNVTITSMQTSVAAGSAVTEQFSLSYSKLLIDAKSMKKDGSVDKGISGGFDFAEGKSF